MSDLTAVSLFAGIEGIGLALHRAGIHVKAAVEIDPECRGVIARHFPGVALFDDVRTVTGDQLRAAGFVPERGVLAGGWPCQDLSIAGRRAGLGGARSGLFWEIVRLAGELSPRWLLLENVDDLLSSTCPCPGDGSCVGNGRAVRCGKLVSGEWQDNIQHNPPGGVCPGGCMAVHGGAMGAVVGALEQLGYGLCWRVLDAQYAGVPQRRSRLFFAGCLGDGAAPAEVLFEPESSERDFETCGTARPGAAGNAGNGAESPGAVAATLQGGGRRGHRIDAEGAAGGHLVLAQNGSDIQVGTQLGALTAGMARQTSGDLIAIPLAVRGRDGGAQIEAGKPGDPAFTLRAGNGGSSRQPLIAHTLTSEGFDASEDGTGRSIPIVPMGMPPVASPLTSGSATGEGVNPPGRRKEDDGDKPTALQASQVTDIQQGMAVRRLTPMECERLQGFPDEWTRWLADGTEQSDSARYRQCGNAVAVPVVEWLARRLVAADAALGESEAVAS